MLQHRERAPAFQGLFSHEAKRTMKGMMTMAYRGEEPPFVEIAESDARFIRVRGAGGAGKSLSAARRVACLLKGGAQPGSIVVFSATASAAEAMRGLLAESEVENARQVKVCTVRDACIEVLDSPQAREVTGRIPRLLADFEERILMEDMKVTGMKPRRLREMLKFFYRSWTELAEDDEGFLVEDDERLVHGTIKRHLALREAMLAPELSATAYRYVRDHPDQVEPWRFDHVIADDFQNLNDASQRFAEALSRVSFMVCGNENEQVPTAEPYPFVRGFVEFKERHPQAACFELGESLRCPPRVAAMAFELMRRQDMAPDEGAPDAQAAAQDAASACLARYTTPNEEFRGVAGFVKRRIEGPDLVHPRRMFIAVPNRTWGRAISKLLRANGIKTTEAVGATALSGDPRVWEKCAALRAYTLLRLATQPQDATAWRSWCGFGDYLTRSNHWNRLEAYAEERGLGIVDALDSIEGFAGEGIESADLPFLGADVLARRYHAGREIVRRQEGRRGYALVNGICEGQTPPEGSKADEGIPAGFAALVEPMTGAESAEELFGRAELRMEQTFADEDAVRIGLPQAAAGLSFDTVVVAGMVDGFYPCADAFGDSYDDEMKDELRAADRRCLYAAMSAAECRLAITCFQKDEAAAAQVLGMHVRRIRQESGSRMAVLSTSSFIDEMGDAAPAFEAALP